MTPVKAIMVYKLGKIGLNNFDCFVASRTKMLYHFLDSSAAEQLIWKMAIISRTYSLRIGLSSVPSAGSS